MAEDKASNIQVRRATSDDLETLVEFNVAMAKETEEKVLDSERLRAGVSQVLEWHSLGFYYVAELSERIVGQLLITTEWSDWRNGNFWWIQSVYVHAAHRRQGVYRALHNHVVEEAKNTDNVCGVRLYVDRDNKVAQQVYSSLEMSHSHYDLWEIDFVL